jgi:hypothetical protein
MQTLTADMCTVDKSTVLSADKEVIACNRIFNIAILSRALTSNEHLGDRDDVSFPAKIVAAVAHDRTWFRLDRIVREIQPVDSSKEGTPIALAVNLNKRAADRESYRLVCCSYVVADLLLAGHHCQILGMSEVEQFAARWDQRPAQTAGPMVQKLQLEVESTISEGLLLMPVEKMVDLAVWRGVVFVEIALVSSVVCKDLTIERFLARKVVTSAGYVETVATRSILALVIADDWRWALSHMAHINNTTVLGSPWEVVCLLNCRGPAAESIAEEPDAAAADSLWRSDHRIGAKAATLHIDAADYTHRGGWAACAAGLASRAEKKEVVWHVDSLWQFSGTRPVALFDLARAAWSCGHDTNDPAFPLFPGQSATQSAVMSSRSEVPMASPDGAYPVHAVVDLPSHRERSVPHVHFLSADPRDVQFRLGGSVRVVTEFAPQTVTLISTVAVVRVCGVTFQPDVVGLGLAHLEDFAGGCVSKKVVTASVIITIADSRQQPGHRAGTCAGVVEAGDAAGGKPTEWVASSVRLALPDNGNEHLPRNSPLLYVACAQPGSLLNATRSPARCPSDIINPRISRLSAPAHAPAGYVGHGIPPRSEPPCSASLPSLAVGRRDHLWSFAALVNRLGVSMHDAIAGDTATRGWQFDGSRSVGTPTPDSLTKVATSQCTQRTIVRAAGPVSPEPATYSQLMMVFTHVDFSVGCSAVICRLPAGNFEDLTRRVLCVLAALLTFALAFASVLWHDPVSSALRTGDKAHRRCGFLKRVLHMWLLCGISMVRARSDVDLATWTKPTQGFDVWGAIAGDNAGYSVAGVGDVNKDGFQDVLVTAFLANVGTKVDAGAAYLVFGTPGRSISTINTANALPPTAIKISGAVEYDNWGSSVSGAGDVNMDGIDDFIIGTYGFDPPSRTMGGAAVVLFGRTGGWSDTNLAFFTSGSAGFWVWGAAAGDGCGNAVSGAGDVNGDGADDVIIGASTARPQNLLQAGTTYIIFGHSTATVFDTIDLSIFVSGSAGFKIFGETYGGRLGDKVDGGRDVNGDGFADVIIGAQFCACSSGSSCGATYVIFGHSAATAFTDIDLTVLSSSQGFRITGVTNAYLGCSVSSAGDFNHDGYDDLVVGSHASKAYVLLGRSSATAFPNVEMASFNAGNAGFVVSGSNNLGEYVDGGVDVNGDGVHDIVLAASSSSTSAAYVLYGRPQLLFTNIDVLSGLSVLTGFRVIGVTSSGGGPVSLVRDFDGDGVGEVLVGAPNASPSGRSGAGIAYLIYGELPAPTSQPTAQPTSQPSRQPTSQPSRQPSARPTSSPVSERTGDVDLAAWIKPRDGLEVWGALAGYKLGNCVAAAGDVNKDGYDDIIIGAREAGTSGKVNAGAAYLVFGSGSRVTSTIDTAAAILPKAVRILGSAAYDQWGYSVSCAGDVNKDGIGDFIIGGYLYDPPSRGDGGAAVVIFGKTSGWADIDLASFTSGSAGFWIFGAATGDACGVAVSGAGDMNGDGADDLIVTASAADPQSKAEAGASYVVFGHSTTTTFGTIDLSVNSGGAWFKIYGATAGDHSGERACSAGDVNGDGFGDVAITTLYFHCSSGASNCGAVYVIFGHSAATAFTDIDLAALSSSRGFRIIGVASNLLGVSVSSAGDFNRDGHGDLVIGALSSKAYILFGRSNSSFLPPVDLALFVAGSAGFMVSGSGDVGFSVGGGVDVNRDGADDVVISASSASSAGAVYVLYGRSQVVFTNVFLQSGLPREVGFRIVGTSVSMSGDWAVGLVRDFDGDGVGDILLGAPNADPSGRLGAGITYLVYGELSAPTSQPSGRPSTQPSMQPSARPSRQPTSQPSRQPSRQPSSQPSRQPTSQPSRQPSARPTSSPVSERSEDVDLATWAKPRQGLEVWGALAGDGAGCTVADAGDVNHDGYQDILIGACFADVSTSPDAGAAYLVFGSPSRSTSVVDTATAVPPKGIKILGVAVADHWGVCVGGAGDINDDGIDDFIVGALHYDPPSRADAGAAVVIFGKTSGWADIYLSSFTSGSAGFWIWSAATGDEMQSVGAAGDVNDDGIDDFVVGTPLADPQNKVNAGTAYVIFGRSASTAWGTIDLAAFTSGTAGFRILGATAGDYSGYSISGVGDINGDGFDDIVTTAIFLDRPSGSDCGAAYVIFGHSNATAFTDIDLAALSSNQGFRITGAAAGNLWGVSISRAGDFNHDGHADVVLGSRASGVFVLFGHSNTTAFTNVDLATFPAGTVGFLVSGDGYFGWSVSGGVDINKDGVDDVAIAAPNTALYGAVYVLYGRSQLLWTNMNVLVGLPSVSGYRILGAPASLSGAWFVSLVRDFDGDGNGEVLVGAESADPTSGRTDAGVAYLVYGELSAPTSQPSRQPTSQPSGHPTKQPTGQPSRQPTSQPSRQPSARPTSSPVSERGGDVDLATWTKPGQGQEVWGDVSGNRLGLSVADAGDVNHDGYQDVLVGAPNASPSGKSNAGAVYVVFGSPGRSTSITDMFTSTFPERIKISGAFVVDLWGNSVSGAGDVNKDGIDDFIIGGHGYDPPSRIQAGAAVVIFGKTSGWVDIDLASFTSGSAGFWIWGAAAGASFGFSVSGAGDVNGDGAGDVIAGAPGSGAAYVVFGHSNATAFGTVDLANLTSAIGGFKRFGAASGDSAGYSVCGAGDVNGDGYDDVVVGAYQFDGPNGRTDSGAAYVIFGHSAATAVTDIDLAALSSNQGFRITGAASRSQLSWSVARGSGDFNHDGYDDVVVASMDSKAYILFGHSNTTAFPNLDLATFAAGTAGFTVSGSGWFGYSVSVGVDVNGDEVDDVAITAPEYSRNGAVIGAAYVLYGRSQLLWTNLNVITELTSVRGYRILGAATASYGEWSVSLVSDFDGDGVGDLVIGMPNADPAGRSNSGTAYVIYGTKSAPTSQPSSQPSGQPTSQPSRHPSARLTSSPVSERAGDVDFASWTKPGQGLEVWGAAGDAAGYRVADAGDVNQDRYQDILVGAQSAVIGSKTNVGAAYLVFGSPGRSTSTIDTTTVEFPRGIKVLGANASDYWGTSVSGAGDFNKDGINDFAVSALGYDPPSRTNAGAVVVIFGKTSGWADIDLASFTSGTAGFWIWGAATGDQLGQAVSGVGDVNGDGADDLVVGCYQASPLSRTGAGTSYVVFGHSTAFATIDLSAWSAGAAGFSIFGAAASDQSGNSVSGAGDVNGDGYYDVAIGAIYYGVVDTGAAYVIFGHSSATAFTDIDLAALSSDQGFRITGAAGSYHLGNSVSSAGDFNQDGYDDLVVGCYPTKAYVILGNANITALITLDLATFTAGTSGFTVFGSGGSFAWRVSGGVDVNRDGADDVIIAAPNYSPGGVAYLLYGRSQLSFTDIDVQSGLSSVSGYLIRGVTEIQGNWHVGLVRDFDGDGVGDVLIGAPQAYLSGRPGAGTAYLIYGELSAPTSQPSRQPTGRPSSQPTLQPNCQPTSQPTLRPSRRPTGQPSGLPTSLPSTQPTSAPTQQPSAQPSRQPSSQPASLPTAQPSWQPSKQPSTQPSSQPSGRPSTQPTRWPTTQPSGCPSNQPSRQPSVQPSRQPITLPSAQPSHQPSTVPTAHPSSQPSSQPSRQPIATPSGQPSKQPTTLPSSQPSRRPTAQPSRSPTSQPSSRPTTAPSAQPTQQPTGVPSVRPTVLPTIQPTTQPSWGPSCQPSTKPTTQPTSCPSSAPSRQPSSRPTAQPSTRPSGQTTYSPSGAPSSQPSSQPTTQPSHKPSGLPTMQPSELPTSQPSIQPSVKPTTQPSSQPFGQPTCRPSGIPTAQPSYSPSGQSTSHPSMHPSQQPTQQPFETPSQQPTGQPSCTPSIQPTSQPSAQPTRSPSAQPSHKPTSQPTRQPTQQPSRAPSGQPTVQPTVAPSTQPISQPSDQPTGVPTQQPSTQPSRQPTRKPSTQPTSAPTKVVVTSATLGCSVSVKVTGRTFAAVEVGLHGARDSSVRLHAVVRVGSSSQSADATAAALQLVADYTAYIVGQMLTTVNVTSLLPSTGYDLYCAATSSQGVTMPLSAVLATKQQLHTACCKAITVTVQLPATVNVGQQLARAVTVALEGPPSTSVVVTLQYAGRDHPSVGVQLLPSVLRYDNRSAVGANKDLRLTALGGGNYTLVVSVTGPSADECRVAYIGSRRLTVLSAEATPATPQLLQAVFSNDGSYVTLSFDVATDRGSLYGTFSCRALVRFVGDGTAQCQWFSDSQLRVYPAAVGVGSVLGVGGNVTLVANTVRARCSDANRAAGLCASYVPAASTTVVVTAPSVPTTPSVVISAPSSIGGCNSLTFDLAGSAGAAGRPWDTVSFAVSTTPVSTSAAAQLLQFLSRNYTLSPPLPVSSTVLTKGYTYSIKVTLCNFLKACGSATKVVSVAESIAPVPVVTIAGQPVRTVYRADALSVVADAYTQSCTGSKSSSGVQYTWATTQLLPGASAYTNATLRSASQNPTVFKLPANTVSVGATYTLTVTAQSIASGQRSSAAVQLKVLQSDLVAVLKGGSTRYAMVGEVVTLDASSSYDKDYPQQALSSAAVTYAWQCLTVAPVLSATCAVTLLEANPGRSSVINVTSTNTALNTTSVVSVTVSDASRSSTAQVRISILQAPSPRLSITAAGPTDNVNTGKPFTLLGSLYLLAPCTATWSVDDPTIALTTAARTPVQQFTLPAAGTTAIPFNLVIKSDALPQRATLQFTLSCGSTVVSTTVTTNGAPLPGSFSVKPAYGIELSTTFTFAAAQWSDPDLPLTYQFGFQSAVSLSNLVIVSRSELSYAASSLPAGDVSRASAVDCSLRIYDSLGAFADRTAVVFVTTQDDGDQASQLVLELLKSSADSVQGVKTALAVGSSVINAVNCTRAPSCGPLNRRPCRMTSGQCGACLDGFAGDAGDRNTLCVSLTAPPVQLATTKGCAYNCTGHGQCIFVSKVTGAPVTECTLADTDCDATCACTDHFSGEFCEIDPVTLRRRREVRSNLILSLSNLTAQEDINTESVAAWSANLYALSIRPHEVSQADAAVLADIANTTLHHAIALGVDSYADMQGVLQATDAVASLLRYNYNPNDYRDADFNTSRSYVNNTAARFVPVVSTFGDMVSNLMVLGENETTLVYDNFCMTVALAVGSRIQETHSVPAGEQQSAAATSTVALHTVIDAVAPAVAIKVMSTNPRSYVVDTADYVSSPVRLQVQTLESEHSSAAEYLSSIEFTFQHSTLQEQYVSYEVRNFSSKCEARNASQTFTYDCPDSGHVIRHNCSQGAGVYVSYCPKPAAACAMLALETAEITTPDACIVLNSTASYTTCRCAVKATSAKLRRSLGTSGQQILDDTGATDMLTTTVYIASDFSDTFKAAGALNDATLSSVVVVVLLLGSVWATGLGVLFVEWALYKWNPAKEKNAKDSDGVQSILAYIDSVIPKVFERGASSVHRFVAEVAEHHVLFQLFTADTPAERWFLMMQALTELTLLFFLTAAFFDISQPGDDGTCPSYSAERGCLERTSPFDYSQKYCKWVAVGVDGGEGQCLYNNQNMSTTALFYMTVLTTVISSIVSIPIEYQFGTLKAPTATSLEGSKVSAVVDTVVSGARRVSNAGLAFFEPARVAPSPSPPSSPSPKSDSSRSKSFRFLQSADGVVANREIPASIAQVSTAARASLGVIGRNASTLALGAEGASRALRSRSTRIARRSTTAGGGNSLVKRDGAGLRLAEPTTLSTVGAYDDDGAELLMQDIVQQRLMMNSSAKETKLFDEQWGVLSDEPANYAIRPEAAACIETAVKESSKEASRLDEVLSNYSLQHAGLEMLHLFMLDLLGRNTIAAKIFREKFGEEFGHSRVVVQLQKYFAAAALLALNAFFMYFVMIKGVQKGRDWQLQYVTCCVIQVGVDILLFETVECAWLNFLVPQYVHEEVASAAEKLRSLTQRIAGLRTDIEETQQGQEVTKFFLNAPAHLFVSTKLARKKPQLLESMIVGSYRHHLPGEICKTWPHCSEREEFQRTAQARTWLSLLRWVLRGLTLSLQLFVGVPFAYQKVGLRFAQPVVFSGLALVIYAIFTSVAGQVVLGMCGLAAIVYAVRRQWNGTGASGAVNPTTAEAVEEPTFINDASSSDNSVDMSSEDTDEVDYWNAEYEDGSNDGAKSSADSESSLGLSAESGDEVELHSDGDEEEDLPEYGESDDPEPEYSGSDRTEQHSETHSAYSEEHDLHSDLQEPDGGAGTGTEGVPSSEPGSWDSDGRSEESRRESDHDSDDSVGLLHTELSNPLHSDSWEGEGAFSHESGSGEEALYSDNESEGSVEEDIW